MTQHPPLWLRFGTGRRLPIYLQTEAAECGLACLAMIASFWGHQMDLASLRRRYDTSLRGSTLKHLMDTAEQLGLLPRALKVPLEQLAQVQLPCIIHWDLGHFVVLARVRANRFIIHDPAVGERRLPLAAVSRSFTGVVLELTPGPTFHRISEPSAPPLTKIFGRIVGLKRGLAQVLLLGLSLQALSLLSPLYVQWLVDDALLAGDGHLITVVAVGFALLSIMQALIAALRSWLTTVLATQLNFQWLDNTFSHLTRLPIPYFEKRHLGDIVSRFRSIDVIKQTLTTQFVEGLIDGALMLTTGAMMLLYSLKLAAIAALAVPVYGLTRMALLKRLREATAEEIHQAASQQTHLLESVRGMQTIRLFGRWLERRNGWLNAVAAQMNAQASIAGLTISYQAAQSLVFGLERILIIYLAALATLHAHFTVGMMLTFVGYQDQFAQRVTALIDKLFELRLLELQAARVADIMLTDAEELHEGSAAPPRPIRGIELCQVSFRYAQAEHDVLKDVTFTIAAGECLAISGPSGCGKTTLVKLLLGLLEPTAGEIRVDGMELKRFGLGRYRALVGTVMQEDLLFAGSILENICFFDPSPDLSRVEECARMAAIDAEIELMPMRYHTLVGDIGLGLSGGQRQRILLARALYKQPQLLILDEATSHLDLGNERRVNAAIRASALTRVIVAHRPETLAMADRLLILQEGRILRDLRQPGSPSLAGTTG